MIKLYIILILCSINLSCSQQIKCLTEAEIREYYLNKNYVEIPIKIEKGVIIRNSEDIYENILNYANLIYTENGYTIDATLKYKREINKLSSPNFRSKAFITKNENLCDKKIKAEIDNKFDPKSYEYLIHEHLWKSPDSNKSDLKFIKYFPSVD